MEKTIVNEIKREINAIVNEYPIATYPEYSDNLSELLNLNPETSGIFYTKDEKGAVEFILDNGEVYPAKFTVEEFIKSFTR